MTNIMKDNDWSSLVVTKLVVRGFGKRLEGAITKKKTTIKRLAREMLCDEQLIKSLIGEEIHPSLAMLIRLSIELDASIDYLLRDSNSMSRDPEMAKYKEAIERQMAINDVIVSLLTDETLSGTTELGIDRTAVKRIRIQFIKRCISSNFEKP